MSSNTEKSLLKLPDIIIQVIPGGLQISSFLPTHEENRKHLLQFSEELEKLGIKAELTEEGWCA